MAISDFYINDGIAHISPPQVLHLHRDASNSDCHRVSVSEICCVLTQRVAWKHSRHGGNATTARIAAIPLLSSPQVLVESHSLSYRQVAESALWMLVTVCSLPILSEPK